MSPRGHHRLCSRTAARLAIGNAESDARFVDEIAAYAIANYTKADTGINASVRPNLLGRMKAAGQQDFR